MKPFLLLGTRAEDRAADNEYAAFLAFTGLPESHLRRVRLEKSPLGTLDLDCWSGIFLGGGPFNSSDPDSLKTPVQRRIETELNALLDAVVRADFPFLGACYGIGTLGTHQGAVVDRAHAEPVGPALIELTPEARADRVFGELPDVFDAFVGHKEAVRVLPPHAVRLAGSAACPVQAFRVGRNVYATQFHPELDVAGLCMRIEVYKHSGYFDPDEAESLKELARGSRVVHPPRILGAFVDRYRRD